MNSHQYTNNQYDIYANIIKLIPKFEYDGAIYYNYVYGTVEKLKIKNIHLLITKKKNLKYF